MIYLFLADGFEEVEAITVCDILRRAEIEVNTVSVTADKTVVGAHGIPVACDIDYSSINYSKFDGVVLPGGMPGTTNLENSDEVKECLLYAFSKHKLVCAICAAPSVLGKLGLLCDKNAVCYPGFEEYLSGAMVSENDVMVDDNIITSRGPATAIPFALAIVEKIKGKTVAQNIANGMLY